MGPSATHPYVVLGILMAARIGPLSTTDTTRRRRGSQLVRTTKDTLKRQMRSARMDNLSFTRPLKDCIPNRCSSRCLPQRKWNNGLIPQLPPPLPNHKPSQVTLPQAYLLDYQDLCRDNSQYMISVYYRTQGLKCVRIIVVIFIPVN